MTMQNQLHLVPER